MTDGTNGVNSGPHRDDTTDGWTPRPVGELGAAFTGLVEDAPPSYLRAGSIINEVQGRRGRRRNILVGAAATVAGLALVTTIIVNGGSASDTAASAVSSSSAASSSSAVNSSVAAMAESAAPGDAAPSVLAGGSEAELSVASDAAAGAGTQSSASTESPEGGAAGAPAPAGSAAATAPATAASSSALSTPTADAGDDTVALPADPSCAAIPLSTARSGIVTGQFPQLVPTDAECDLTDDLRSVGIFGGETAAGAATLTVELHDPVVSCVDCTPVDGHPGVTALRYGTGDEFVRVYAAGGALVLIAVPGDGGTTPPFSLDELGTLADALAATL